MNPLFTNFIQAQATLALACACLLVGATGEAMAQDQFPVGPVSIIVPNPPGGSSDINARILSEPLSAALKQPVVILNKPGLGGAIGAAQVAKAKPDGYTLLLALSSVVVAPEAELHPH